MDFVRMKHFFCLVVAALGSLCLMACHSDLTTEQTKIMIGENDLSSIDVYANATRMIKLKGGTGKYKAYINNSVFASALINEDTLRVTGILEGETYASIWSGDECRKLDIRVTTPEITSTEDVIRLYPGDESRSVSINGGGAMAEMEVHDPMHIMSKTKWNAKTNLIEIDAFCEGDAYITIIGQDKTKKTIKVEVRCKGEASERGAYSTTSRSLSVLMRNTLIVNRKGLGVWICNEANPMESKKTIKLTPAVVNPKVGEYLDMNIMLKYPDEFSSIKEGQQQLYVQEVRPTSVVLVGRGFKLVVPYEKK